MINKPEKEIQNIKRRIAYLKLQHEQMQRPISVEQRYELQKLEKRLSDALLLGKKGS